MKLFCSVFLVLLLLGAQQAQELQPVEDGCNVATAAPDILEGVGNLIGDSLLDRLSPPSWQPRSTTKKRKRNRGYGKKKSGGSGKSGGRGKSRRRSKPGRRGKSGGRGKRRGK